MKNGKKIFILVETFLGLMVFVLVMFMFLEKNEKKQEKISVIIQNSDDSQWAAFKYGAKMAAADKKTEVFVVSTAGSLSVQEEENLIEREIANGASGIIVEPANGEKAEKMLKEVERKSVGRGIIKRLRRKYKREKDRARFGRRKRRSYK